jgi:hypothetical protein
VAGLGLTFNALKITGAVGNNALTIKQRIESYLALGIAGKRVTVQFKLKNNTGANLVPRLTINHPTAQDNYGAIVTDVNDQNFFTVVDGATQVYGYSFIAHANSVFGLEFIINLNAAGSSFNTTGKSVTISELDLHYTPNMSNGVVTPPNPELRFIQIEDELCRRYYQRFGGAANYVYSMAALISATQALGRLQFLHLMRAVPAASVSAANTFALDTATGAFTPSGIVIDLINTQCARIWPLTVAGATIRESGAIRDGGAGTSFIAFSSEL